MSHHQGHLGGHHHHDECCHGEYDHSCCHEDSCDAHHHHHHHHGHEDFADQLIDLADEAWMEVLKDKIKENISASSEHLDQLAKMVTEVNKERWINKMSAKKQSDDFKEKLHSFFSPKK